MSVPSIDGFKTWSTKLNRIGELSAGNPVMVFNNLGHIIDYDLLKELRESPLIQPQYPTTFRMA